MGKITIIKKWDELKIDFKNVDHYAWITMLYNTITKIICEMAKDKKGALKILEVVKGKIKKGIEEEMT